MNSCMPIHSFILSFIHGGHCSEFQGPTKKLKTKVNLIFKFIFGHLLLLQNLVGWLIGLAGVVYKGPRLTYQSVLAINRAGMLSTAEPVSRKRASLTDYQNRLIGQSKCRVWPGYATVVRVFNKKKHQRLHRPGHSSQNPFWRTP